MIALAKGKFRFFAIAGVRTRIDGALGASDQARAD
jgi:hypothetical protein